MKRKPIYYQRSFLVFLGFLLSLFFLEVGLRLAGFTLTLLQENRNRISLKNGGDYRILCLGESTTQGQYPPFLESTLNQNAKGMKFTVLDEGRAGTNTTAILNRAEAFLDQYHPDMVVAMMGINDGDAPHVPHENPSAPQATSFLRSFKIHKLARFLWLHLVTRTKESGRRIAPSAPEFDSKDEQAYVELGSVYSQQGRFAEAEASLKKALELNPKSEFAYAELGSVYSQQERSAEAETSLKKALQLNPRYQRVYVELGQLYREQAEFAQAEVSFKKALELNPRNGFLAHMGLGKVYQQQGQFARAKASLKKAQELNPGNKDIYLELGDVYRQQGNLAQAEASLKKAQELDPKDEQIYIALGIVDKQQGRPKRAERWFRKGLEFSHSHTRARLYGELAALSEKDGQIQQAQEYSDKASLLIADGLASIDLPTARNYQALKVMLDKRHVRLVCVQYPMRPISSLEKIFAGEGDNIIFVDNENIFRNAIGQDGLNAYFVDMFAGNFGHCTEKGNRLLGENIAKAILREMFDSLAGIDEKEGKPREAAEAREEAKALRARP